MHSSFKRENLTTIQALRGLAAIWVVFFHASEGGHVNSLKQVLPKDLFFIIFEAGHFGVAIFFALSGFVISYGLTGKHITKSFFGRFIIKRSIRLDPTYWASMIIAIFFIIVSSLVKAENIAFPSAENIVFHVLYLQVIFNQPQINAVYWTLTYEVQFYLFLIGLLTVKNTITSLCSSAYSNCIDIILCGSAFFSAIGAFNEILPGLFLPLWGCFYVGVLANRAQYGRIQLTCFALLCISLILQNTFSCISATTAIFILFSVATGWARYGMNWKWIQFLGLISYSLYLIHNPVTGAMGFAFKALIGTGAIPDTIKLIMIVSASIFAGYLLWYFVERKTHAFAQSIPAQGQSNL